MIRVISLFVLILSFPAFAETSPAPYKIAAILPLSGPVASLGHYVKNGIDLALKNLPAEQRKLVEVIYEDDQFNPKNTITAYRRLASKIDAVFVLASPPALALKPIIERDKKIMIAIGASDPDVVKNAKFSFIHWVIPEVLGDKLAQEIQKRSYKRIAFFTSEISGAIADTNAAIQALDKLGLKSSVIFNENFPLGVTDFRSSLTNLRSKNPDVIVIVMAPEQLSILAKQIKQMGFTAGLAGMETLEDESAVKAAQGALDGAWYVNASNPTAEYVEKYQAEYNEHTGWASANGYDSINLIAAAVLGQGRDAAGIAGYLKSIKDYSGAAGVYSASGDGRFSLPAELRRIEDGKFLNLE